MVGKLSLEVAAGLGGLGCGTCKDQAWLGQPAGNQHPLPPHQPHLDGPTCTGLVSPCPCSPWILGSNSQKWLACRCAGSMLVTHQESDIWEKISSAFS